jgi:hypothetical protein
MELARTAKTGISIADEKEVLSYTHDGKVAEVIARVDLDDIAGGSAYVLNFYIDGVVVSPSSVLEVADGRTRTIMISRQIPLEPGDEVSIRVTGVAGDTSVSVTTTLRDATPAKTSDLVGEGTVAVDHDYGGADNMTVMTSDGRRIDRAAVWVFRREDYDNGRRDQRYALSQIETDVNGRWKLPAMLDPGDYTAYVFKRGVIKPKANEFTVS